MSEGRHGPRAVLLSGIANVIPPVAAFVCAPLLAQGLGVEDRGVVAAAMAPLLLAASSVTFGLPEAVTFFVSRGQGSGALRRSIFYLILGGLAATAALWSIAPFVGSGSETISGLIRLAGLALIPALIVGLLRAYAGALGRWGLTTFESLASSLLRLAWVLSLFLTDTMSVRSATLAMVITLFAGVLAYVPLLFRRNRQKQTAAVKSAALLTYGSRVWVGSLSGILLTYLDQTLMVPLASPRELGLYSVCVSVAAVVLVFNTTLRGVVFAAESGAPSLGRLAQATRLSNAATLFLAGVVAVCSPVALPVLFGHEFGAATPTLIVLLVAVVAGNPGSLAGVGLSARGRPGMRSLSLAIACVVNAALVFALVPSFGAIGAAWATVVGNVLSAILNLLWLRRLYGASIRDSVIPARGDARAGFRLFLRLLGKA